MVNDRKVSAYFFARPNYANGQIRLNGLVGVMEAAAEDSGEDHLNVLEEGIVVEIVEVDADLVGEDYLVVVFLGVGLLCKQLLLVAVFEGGGTGDAGTQFQDVAVLPFQLVGVAGYVGTRADEAHVADQDVPEFRELVEFVFAEFSTQRSDTALPCYRYRAASVANCHGTELVHCKEFAVTTDTFLFENHGTTGHLDTYEYGYDEQYSPQTQKADESHQPIENIF